MATQLKVDIPQTKAYVKLENYEADKETSSESEDHFERVSFRKSLPRSKKYYNGLCLLAKAHKPMNLKNDGYRQFYLKEALFVNGNDESIMKLLPTPRKSREPTELSDREYDADSEGESSK